MNTFSAGGAIRAGWETFKKRPWFFVGVLVLVVVIEWIIGFVVGLVLGQHPDGAAGFLVTIINIGVGTLIGLGLTALMLKAVENPMSAQFEDLWHPQQFWQYLAVSILVGICVVIGFILLIVPGVIIALMWMFAKYIVVARTMGPIEAMKESARITKGHKLDLFLLVLMILGINILGLICIVIGLLVSIPVSSLAIIHAYRMLEQQASAPMAA